jgi:hypothetical protein
MTKRASCGDAGDIPALTSKLLARLKSKQSPTVKSFTLDAAADGEPHTVSM